LCGEPNVASAIMLSCTLFSSSPPSTPFSWKPPQQSRSAACTRSCSSSTSTKSLFIFGLGYIGSRLCTHFLQSNSTFHSISGTYRTTRPSYSAHPNTTPFNAFQFDPLQNLFLTQTALEYLHNSTHILITIPPDSHHILHYLPSSFDISSKITVSCMHFC